ncbi:MAG: response regulator [Clostridia bacterium]|nr:response regulator [Clostridia bacterium]
MLRVFIVEDESIIRETLRDTVPWGQCGFEFAGEAADGEIALPMILKTKPDVLITDIRMPFMDGLALSKQVLREFPQMKVIIISGFDDFELAQKAIDIGVEQYLLKPISKAKLIAVLDNIRGKIEAERMQTSYLSQYHIDEQEHEQYARRHFLEQAVSGQLTVEQIYEEAGKLDMDLRAQCYTLAFFSIVPESQGKAEQYRDSAAHIRDALLGHFLKYSEHILARWDLTTYAVFIKGDESKMPDYIARCIDTVQKQYEASPISYNWYVAVGTPTQRLSTLPQCAEEVQRLVAYRYILPSQHILTAQTVGALTGTGGSTGLAQMDAAKVNPAVLTDVMRNAGAQEIPAFIDEYVHSVAEGLESKPFCQYLMLNVRFAAAEYVASLGVPQQDFLSQLNCLDMLEKTITAAELKGYMAEILLAAVTLRDEVSSSQSRGLINQAAGYIDSHFTDENLSLNRVAREVNISANYLSAVFSQEMGRTLTEYITGKRMEKAKELLRTTDKHSGEIAFEIGYRDSHYFSFIFKKTQGCTPRDFRAGRGSGHYE